MRFFKQFAGIALAGLFYATDASALVYCIADGMCHCDVGEFGRPRHYQDNGACEMCPDGGTTEPGSNLSSKDCYIEKSYEHTVGCKVFTIDEICYLTNLGYEECEHKSSNLSGCACGGCHLEGGECVKDCTQTTGSDEAGSFLLGENVTIKCDAQDAEVEV
ncbi:MAG: hypothetical protein LBR41_00365 [Rickettsiales bacterium]|jgi:hypothetical protein|nr:hypothetical protein [Rickettsiales bacterium]